MTPSVAPLLNSLSEHRRGAGPDLVRSVAGDLNPHHRDDDGASPRFEESLADGRSGIEGDAGSFEYGRDPGEVTVGRDEKIAAIPWAIDGPAELEDESARTRYWPTVPPCGATHRRRLVGVRTDGGRWRHSYETALRVLFGVPLRRQHGVVVGVDVLPVDERSVPAVGLFGKAQSPQHHPRRLVCLQDALVVSGGD